MAIQSEKTKEQWMSLRKLGTGGWDLYNDYQDIADTALADVQNISFDKGYPTPRRGSILKWTVPDVETNPLLALMGARDSIGNNYAVACYAPNFYLRDEVNDQWVKLNSSYTPSATYKSLMYGYTNWNAGVGADVLYAGNGKESAIKWQIGVGYVKTLASSGAVAIVLDDSTMFPATGTIVLKTAGGAEVYTTYSANVTATGTLTVPALGADVAAGTCVAFQILEATTVAKGKIIGKWQNRLFIANSAGHECLINISQEANPENFVLGTTAKSPYNVNVIDGVGGISGVDDFGEYLLIEKDDSMHKMSVEVVTLSDGTTQLSAKSVPIISDISMGPVNPWSRIKKNNLLYYATLTEGVFQINPDITGQQTSVQTNIISKPIRPLVQTLDFTNTRITSFDQKIMLSATSDVTGDVVMVYDILRSSPADGVFTWTKYTNWNVRDWLRHNKKLYYGSRVDNNIYEALTDEKIDGVKPYETYFKTKAFDFGQGALPKTTSHVFVSGYITPQTTLYFDVILTTGDSVQTTTYALKGNGKLLMVGIPKALAMAMLGVFSLGDAEIETTTGLFRCYLAVPQRYGWYTLQIKAYSNIQATDWGVTGLGFSPWVELKAPGVLHLGQQNDPTVANLQ